MKWIGLFCLLTISITKAEEFEIPILEGVTDSLIHPELGDSFYTSAPCNGSMPERPNSQNIGDFDGDGADDIFVQWSIEARYYNKTGQQTYRYSAHYENCHYNRYHMGVYSFRKKKYLFSTYERSGTSGKVHVGDYDGDGRIDFVMNGKIYLGANSLHKKKVYP
jgi:hypothetical protein